VLQEVDYKEALELQRKLVEEVYARDIPGIFLLLEHPPVITMGRRAKEEHLLYPREVLVQRGVEVYEVERGGDVTYHGPGQIVGYPIVNLRFWQRDVHAFLRNLEELLIRFLKIFGIAAFRFPPYTGVWVKEGSPKKIAAIGVAVRHWVTFHGFALNVCDDLSPFQYIVPCGIRGFEVTSLQEVLGKKFGKKDLEDMKYLLAREFGEVFGFSMEESHG
jgi:lipoate-protein ligase B